MYLDPKALEAAVSAGCPLDPHDERSIDERIADAIRSYLSASIPAEIGGLAKELVFLCHERVKPLEWTRNLHGITQWAETPFGTYAIDPTRAKPTRYMWSGVIGEWNTVDTEDEAKAAAQADFETRIISALTHPVPTHNDGSGEVTEAMLRRAIKAYHDTPEYDHHRALKNALEAALRGEAS